MKTITIDNIEYNLVPVEELETTTKPVYPLWVKSRTNGQVVKFTSPRSGVVVANGFSGHHSVGYSSDLYISHSETWEQVTEPRIFWEPSEEDLGYIIRHNGLVVKNTFDYSNTSMIYETAELAQQARGVLVAEQALRKACFELGGTGFEVGGDNYCTAMEGSSLSVDRWHTYKSFPSWYFLPSSKACERLIETHEAELLLWLNR